MVSVLEATLNHTPLQCRWPIKICNWIKHVYLSSLGWPHQLQFEVAGVHIPIVWGSNEHIKFCQCITFSFQALFYIFFTFPWRWWKTSRLLETCKWAQHMQVPILLVVDHMIFAMQLCGLQNPPTWLLSLSMLPKNLWPSITQHLQVYKCPSNIVEKVFIWGLQSKATRFEFCRTSKTNFREGHLRNDLGVMHLHYQRQLNSNKWSPPMDLEQLQDLCTRTIAHMIYFKRCK